MPNPRSAQAGGSVFAAGGADRSGVDMDLACVVGASRVNRIVATRIAQRTGLKVVDGAPEEVGSEIASRLPCVVILDGGADNLECDGVIEMLALQRRISEVSLPFVILLTTAIQSRETLAAGNVIDVTVAKPITPERLQPVIQRFLDRVRD